MDGADKSWLELVVRDPEHSTLIDIVVFYPIQPCGRKLYQHRVHGVERTARGHGKPFVLRAGGPRRLGELVALMAVATDVYSKRFAYAATFLVWSRSQRTLRAEILSGH